MLSPEDEKYLQEAEVQGPGWGVGEYIYVYISPEPPSRLSQPTPFKRLWNNPKWAKGARPGGLRPAAYARCLLC